MGIKLKAKLRKRKLVMTLWSVEKGMGDEQIDKVIKNSARVVRVVTQVKENQTLI